MRITRDGSLIQVGDATIGPGTDQGLAQIIRRKVGGRWIKVH